MKKSGFIVAIVATLLMVVASSCTKEEQVINRYYYTYNGDYVFTGYCTIEASANGSNSWERKRHAITDTIMYAQYDFELTYEGEDGSIINAIDDVMMNKSFVVVYLFDADADGDIPLPYVFSYTAADGSTHKAMYSYEVVEGLVHLRCTALDDDYVSLMKYLYANKVSFKVACMYVNE